MRVANGSSWARRAAAIAVAGAASLLIGVSAAWANSPRPLGVVPHQNANANHPAQSPGVPWTHLGAATASTSHPNLTYHNGHVMQTNHVHVVFWTGGIALPAGYESAITQYFTDVAADVGRTSNVYAAATQYTDKFTGHVQYSSSFDGSVVDSTPFVRGCRTVLDQMCITDDQIAQFVHSTAVAQSWSGGSTNLIAVVTPPNVNVCFNAADATRDCSDTFDGGFCAYHGWAGPGENGVADSFVYMVQPFEPPDFGCDPPAAPNGIQNDIAINTLSHEQNESMTDPFGEGWWDSSNPSSNPDYGMENGDKCAWDFGVPVAVDSGSGEPYNQLINGHPYVLQQEWSNARHGCFQIGSPTLASATPSTGSPGDPIGLTGTNFFNVDSVKFNGLAAQDFTTDSPTHVTATVPNGISPGKIAVATDFGSATSSFAFSVPLVVSGAAPLTGKAGTPVTINGSGFQGITSVRFTGLNVTGLNATTVSSPFTISAGAIHTKVPTAAISGPITVSRATVSQQTAPFDVMPVVSSFSPSSGVVGTNVTVNGSGFDSTSIVHLAGGADVPVTPTTANKLVVILPDGATTGKLTVETDDGGASNPSASTLKIGPKLTSFTGTPVVPGQAVDVNGFNLADVTVLKLGSLSVPFTHDVDDPAHLLHFTVPTAGLSGKLFVQSPNGTFTSGGLLLVRPRIDSMSVSSGPTGTAVQLNGAAFTGSNVKFWGLNRAPSVSAPASVSAGGTILKTVVPAAAVTGEILVSNAFAGTPSPDFTVLPKITSFSPASGNVTSNVTINGSGFDGGTTVDFGGVAAGTTRDSANKLVANVPDGAKTGAIHVTTSVGDATSTGTYKVGPRITGFTPQVQADHQVEVDGFNLDEVTTLKLGSMTIAPDDEAAHVLHFTVPDNGVTGKIFVQSASGSFTTSGNLGVAPTIDSLVTTSGPTGTKLTLTGKTFTGIKSVTMTGFGGVAPPVAVPFHLVGTTQMQVTVPTGALTSRFHIVSAGGESLSDEFFVTPTVTSFSPTSAPTGKQVTVNGSGFEFAMSATVGGMPAQIAAVTANKATLTLPDGFDSGKIVVHNSGGDSPPSTGTLTASMSITQLSETTGIAGDTLIVTGKGFGTGTLIVTVAGQQATVHTPHTATQVSVTVPVNTGSGKVTAQNGSTTVESAADFTITTAPLASDSPQFGAAAAR